jgi:endo-alpha-1,4-polygalactosaminidase (GH114 family)
MNDQDRENLVNKIESEGFDYAIVEYGADIDDAEYNRLRQAYLDAGRALAAYLEVDL